MKKGISKEIQIMSKGIKIVFLLAALALPVGTYAQVITYPSRTSTNNYRVRTLVNTIQTKTAALRTLAEQNSDTRTTARADRIDNAAADLDAAVDALKNDINARRDTNADLMTVLQRAADVDRVVSMRAVNNRIQTQWSSLRPDFDALARNYNVAWNWNNDVPNTYPNNGGVIVGRGGFDARLTGTYRLNTSLSDNVDNVLDRSLGSYNVSQRANYRSNLERRLGSPDMIVLEKINNRVTMASSLAPQVAFDADGVARAETNARGRTMTTTVSADRNAMTIRYQGERANDFNVTFTPMANGQLRVAKTLYLENQSRTITVASVYDKTDRVARWSDVNYNNNNNTANNGGYNTGGYDNAFLIPNGTRLTARLDSNISTRASQVGDRFTMSVTSPYQYNGAIIEGHVANASNSGRVSGRANVSLEFDSIRMPTGRSYSFAGLVNSVRPLNGDNVSIDNEGAVRDSNQTTKTVTRAGIGAVLGAIIGAVAGGGEGAAIGATVGAGAGAGSVLIQGRDNIDLAQGSEFVITASSPAGVGPIR
jgi:hypothetical protein